MNDVRLEILPSFGKIYISDRKKERARGGGDSEEIPKSRFCIENVTLMLQRRVDVSVQSYSS